MFIPFLYELRSRGVPVGAQEALALARALGAGLHDSSLDGFYHVARAILIHSEAHLDAFDEAFLAHFRGIEAAGQALTDELYEWLRDAAGRRPELTPEERALFEQLDPEEIERLFAERLGEQTERHDGGDKWIGTGGKSPFGHGGAARAGIRVGGPGGGRSAIRVADARKYRPYRGDLALDVRQMQIALRRLRAFVREGADEELDLEGTIDATAQNAGELEVVTRPPRRPNTRVVLMMDVGGSMDPYAHLVSRLFSATKRSTHFKDLRTYYFHNCIYGKVYSTERFDEPIRVPDLLHELRQPLQADHGGRRADGALRAVVRRRLGSGRRRGHRGHRVADAHCRSLPALGLAQPGAGTLLERHHHRVRARGLLHVSLHPRWAGRGGGAAEPGTHERSALTRGAHCLLPPAPRRAGWTGTPACAP